MTKLLRLIWISFLSVFGTSQSLDSVEGEIESLFEDTKKVPTSTPQREPNLKDPQG